MLANFGTFHSSKAIPKNGPFFHANRRTNFSERNVYSVVHHWCLPSHLISKSDRQSYAWKYPGAKHQVQCIRAASNEQYSPTPPKSIEDAIKQARTSLQVTVGQSLLRQEPGGFKSKRRVTGPRVSVEIPILDPSVEATASTIDELFGGLFLLGKNEAKVGIVSFLGDETKKFKGILSKKGYFVTSSKSGITLPNEIAAIVLVQPTFENVEEVEDIVKSAGSRPVIAFNPNWINLLETTSNEVLESFQAVYCFQPLEIKVLILKTEGAVFKFVEKGKPEASPWLVLTEKDGKLSVSARLTRRPTMGELDNLLYSVMAVNSPVTKTASFVKSLFKR